MNKETEVEISPSIFPGIPQWEKFDFFIVLMSLPTSNGLVFNIDKFGTPCNGSKFGTGSSLLGTFDLDVKNLLKILLFWYGSLTTFSFSTKGGVQLNFSFFQFYENGKFLFCRY